ncbi:hypothetical protein ACWCQ0_53370 [Streptomyces massasporeus]
MTKHFPRSPAAGAAALTLALALTACSTSGKPSGEASGARPPGGGGSAAALSHIHGLGLRGDSLYVATHQGIYTPDSDGSPLPVGDRRDDFMGFTVTADGDFLASGHPAPGTDGPEPRGTADCRAGARPCPIPLKGHLCRSD